MVKHLSMQITYMQASLSSFKAPNSPLFLLQVRNQLYFMPFAVSRASLAYCKA